MIYLSVRASLAVTVLVGLLGSPACPAPSKEAVEVAPPAPRLYTATRQVRALQVTKDGDLCAATAGGWVRWRAGSASAPECKTVADGLPSSDIWALAADGSPLFLAAENGKTRPVEFVRTANGWGVTATHLVRRKDGRRFALPEASDEESASRAGTITALGADKAGVYLASALGFWRLDVPSGRWAEIALPKDSPASHVSALLVEGEKEITAGLYGDGLYGLRFVGGAAKWERLGGATPDVCRYTTALAVTDKNTLAVGTAAGGVWNYEEKRAAWAARSLPNGLPSADLYGLASFNNALYMATFDKGLLRLEPGTGEVSEISGTAGPWTRQLVVWQGALYVRHTTGQVDRVDKGGAATAAFAPKELPRPEVYALAVSPDKKRLLAGGWAGWAVKDAKGWTHHYKDEALAGQVITAIAETLDGTVWLGTQKKGLFRYQDGVYTHIHEAHGLTDDWITALAPSPDGKRLLIGTYTGGLLVWGEEEKKAARLLDTGGFAVRTIGFLGNRAVVATPLGVYREGEAEAAWQLLDPKATGGLEAQTLLPAQNGLWVGTRTSLAYWKE